MFILTVMLVNGIQTPHGEQPEDLGIVICDIFSPWGAIVLKNDQKVTTLYRGDHVTFRVPLQWYRVEQDLQTPGSGLFGRISCLD